MSNEEKLKRAEYRKFRKTMIIIQAIILSIISIVAIYSSVVYIQLSKEEFVTYSETCETDYKVYLKDNPFYEEEYLGKGQSYIASIIKSVESEFEYKLLMDSNGVKFDYSYWIDAELEILDNTSGRVIYKPATNLVNKKTYTCESGILISIVDTVSIDYDEYNQIAEEFVRIYNLEQTTNTLIVKLHVEVKEEASHFADIVNNSYEVSINIPLTTKTVNVNVTSTIPTSKSKVLLLENAQLNKLYKTLAIVFSSIDAVLIVALICFIYFTRNNDINYSIKVKRILSSYKSYIQRILNPFEYEHYKVITLASFKEMLDIRDTVHSPILMYENEDQTCSTFVIPTNTDLLYLYEIKVADYEEIYQTEKKDELGNTIIEKEVIVEKPVEVIKEVIVEKEVEVVIEKPVEVIKEVIVEKPVIVTKEVIVEKVVKEPVEVPNTIKVVKVERKQKPIILEQKDDKPIVLEEKEKPVRNKPKEVIKLEPTPIVKETPKNKEKVKVQKTKPNKPKYSSNNVSELLIKLVTAKTSLEGRDPRDHQTYKKTKKDK